ncbi:MAG: UbiA family prenyltransferase [Furfurilactobacillus sp.]|jgi:1,4-dihydroxy-2-naphthoate octaprenyltransferase|uniref:UbiA family prenyltransferase n=1 Tax=Furfurilactobacillus milii TaxID=2888272 RepID=A0ABT6D8X4_9LACO|nr:MULTISPECIES: UbiA family prenyltransferase [Furfurilactobacillus]QLE66821.1 prenyltransferase contains 14-dihydroxy-2-naphthoate octaprenyltransferase [Furfurilactobacillus rossiae]MCF6160707.1 UbiA family prenyltransferase [Furfurilactobacillus milii]MCF6162939.1 UbiA family prenyltransferase [Furfurilactobacillus milii]MCF6420141.1 UbiA family prenyltransferase [Furfurilactobacillus milii]MCH4010408.1 UbiA family prenyltransferase [Furfurilactobacillus sp.]
MKTDYKPLTWPLFLELIRLPAKTASLLPFLLGTSYAYYAYGQFNWLNTLIYFIGQMSIAFFVTGFNNVQDYYKAKDLAYRGRDNILGREHLNPRHMMALMMVFLIIACSMGILLIIRTNLVLLFIGGLAILIAITYTAGPVPLSRMPLGEILSGLCEGFGTIFIAAYVNMPKQLPIAMYFDGWHFVITANLAVILTLFVIALPIVILDGGVMYADNICDLQQDMKNQRFTLPYYLGKQRAVKLYPFVPGMAFVFVIIGILLGWLPWLMIVVFGLIPVVIQHTKAFLAVQDKGKTFITAIQNLLSVASVEVAVLVVMDIIRLLKS